jgi:hypothetical protein
MHKLSESAVYYQTSSYAPRAAARKTPTPWIVAIIFVLCCVACSASPGPKATCPLVGMPTTWTSEPRNQPQTPDISQRLSVASSQSFFHVAYGDSTTQNEQLSQRLFSKSFPLSGASLITAPTPAVNLVTLCVAQSGRGFVAHTDIFQTAPLTLRAFAVQGNQVEAKPDLLGAPSNVQRIAISNLAAVDGTSTSAGFLWAWIAPTPNAPGSNPQELYYAVTDENGSTSVSPRPVLAAGAVTEVAIASNHQSAALVYVVTGALYNTLWVAPLTSNGVVGAPVAVFDSERPTVGPPTAIRNAPDSTLVAWAEHRPGAIPAIILQQVRDDGARSEPYVLETNAPTDLPQLVEVGIPVDATEPRPAAALAFRNRLTSDSGSVWVAMRALDGAPLPSSTPWQISPPVTELTEVRAAGGSDALGIGWASPTAMSFAYLSCSPEP